VSPGCLNDKIVGDAGAHAAGGTPEQFGTLIKSEIEKDAKVEKQAKLRLE
jgi:hypothetical protein